MPTREELHQLEWRRCPQCGDCTVVRHGVTVPCLRCGAALPPESRLHYVLDPRRVRPL